MSDTIYDRALDECYAATVAPDYWPTALRNLVGVFGAADAMFYPKDVEAAAVAMPATATYTEFLEDYVAGEWYVDHYRADRGWPLLNSGRTVVIEHDLATDEERRKLATYNELYLKWGYSGFAAVGFKVDGQSWCVPMLRRTDQGFFTREEAKSMERLAPHLRRMVKLSGFFNNARGITGLEILDTLAEAAVLIAADRSVIEMNAPARALLEDNPRAIRLVNGRLTAIHADSNRALHALVGQAVRLRAGFTDAARAVPIPILRPGRRPLVAEVVDLPAFVTRLHSEARVIVLLRDPDAAPRTSAETLQSILGLTEAEATFAVLLANGDSIDRAAEFLGIARETARHRLKSIFAKTDTHRQGELVALLRNVMR